MYGTVEQGTTREVEGRFSTSISECTHQVLTKKRKKVSAAMFTFGAISSKMLSIDFGFVATMAKDVVIIVTYNVNKIHFEILTYSFVLTFSVTPCIPIEMKFYFIF